MSTFRPLQGQAQPVATSGGESGALTETIVLPLTDSRGRAMPGALGRDSAAADLADNGVSRAQFSTPPLPASSHFQTTKTSPELTEGDSSFCCVASFVRSEQSYGDFVCWKGGSV